MIIYCQSIDKAIHTKQISQTYKIKNGIARSEYSDNDKKLFFMDVKALNILYYGLGKSEFDRIIFYKNAQKYIAYFKSNSRRN